MFGFSAFELEHHLKMLRLLTFLREHNMMARQYSAESVDY